MTVRIPPDQQKKRGRKPGTGGRPKGVPNKITADVRQAIALVIQGNADKFAKMLNKITDPKQFCETYLKAAEYHIPKLAKVEQTVRHAVTAEQMTDAELAAVAGDEFIPGRSDSPSEGERTH